MIASLSHFFFVDCCVSATAAAFVTNNPSCQSCPTGCHVASCHADTSCLLAPPPLVVLPLLIAPLLSLSSSWMSCRLSSRQRLPSTGASASCWVRAVSLATTSVWVMAVATEEARAAAAAIAVVRDVGGSCGHGDGDGNGDNKGNCDGDSRRR